MPDVFNKRFLLIPIALFLLFFAIDKIAFIPAVKARLVHWKKIEPLFYESREWLHEQWLGEYEERAANNQRAGLILGSSRSAGFDSDIIAKTIPNSYTYNFSAPFACPAFHYYWLKRNLDAGLEPDFVLLEAGPLLFTNQAIEYSLKYSFDWSFVASHTQIGRTTPPDPWQSEGKGFSYKETDDYFLTQLFGFYKYPLKLSVIEANSEKPFPNFSDLHGYEFKAAIEQMARDANRVKLGAIPNELFAGAGPMAVPPHMVTSPEFRDLLEKMRNPEAIREDSEAKAKQFLVEYEKKLSPTQIIFFKKILRLLAERDIPVLVYWPINAPPFEEEMQRYQIHAAARVPVQDMVAGIERQYPEAHIRFVDIGDDSRWQCRIFNDAFHLNGTCFPEITRMIFEQLPDELQR